VGRDVLGVKLPGTVAPVALATVVVTAKVMTLVIDPPGGANEAGAATTSLGPHLDVALFTVVQLLYLGLTCLLIARRPRHPITWLMAAIVLLTVLGGLSEAVTAQPVGAPEPLWWNIAAWYGTWYFVAFLSAFVLLFHLFPTGRPIRGSLAWGTRTAMLAAALITLWMMTGPADATGVPNPLEISAPSWITVPVSTLLAVAWLITVLTIIPILVVRFRRSHREERQQLKWFMFCTAAALGLYAMQPLFEQPLSDWLFLVAIVLPGIGIGVALLRYRLYDIDRIISRTSSYAVVTGILLATYVIVVTAVSRLLGSESSLAVAAATLTAAALARPALQRTQAIINRRFNRARYDAIQVIDDFGTRLRTRVDSHRVREDLVNTVNATLQPEHVTVWTRNGA
jgi:hypothetical protein